MRILRRLACLPLVFILMMSVTAGGTLQNPPQAQADIGPIPLPGVPNPCDLIPDGTARTVCNAATNPVGTVAGAVGLPSPTDVISGAASSAAHAVLQPLLVQFTQAEGDAVLTVLKDMTKFANTKTTPDTNAEWFKTQYELVAGLAVSFALLFLLFRVGMARGDPTETGNSAMAMFVFLVLIAVAPALVAGILKATDDEFSPQWMAHFNANGSATLDKVQSDMTNKLTVIGTVGAILLPLVILFFGLMASVLFDLMLVFRYEVIFVITGLLPVAAAFKVAGRWGGNTFEKTAYGLVGWIVMKPIMVMILTFGLLIMTQGGGVEPVTLGAGILVLSVVGTWKVTQMISNHNIRQPHDALWNSGIGLVVRKWAAGAGA